MAYVSLGQTTFSGSASTYLWRAERLVSSGLSDTVSADLPSIIFSPIYRSNSATAAWYLVFGTYESSEACQKGLERRSAGYSENARHTFIKIQIIPPLHRRDVAEPGSKSLAVGQKPRSRSFLPHVRDLVANHGGYVLPDLQATGIGVEQEILRLAYDKTLRTRVVSHQTSK